MSTTNTVQDDSTRDALRPMPEKVVGDEVMVHVRELVKTYREAGAPAAADNATGTGTGTRPRAVDGVSFEIYAGEMFTLLGPSGCGKTTMLRSIAGLEKPDSGTVTVGGDVFFDGANKVNVPVNSRGIGMVFQSYAIWPHMSVWQNIAFPLLTVPRKHRQSKKQISVEVDRVLDVTGLAGFADRKATKLSGGQQQRLALARALVIKPSLLLLDEPLSNLDAKLRESMRFELKRMQRELGVTSIYVTHDQGEALALSNRIAVMDQGRIAQIGRPRDVYEHPESRFVADFIGTTNFLSGVVESVDSGRATACVRSGGDDGLLLTVPAVEAVAVGDEAMVSVRPENVDISVVEPVASEPVVGKGTVVARAYMGDSVDHEISVGEDLLIRSKCNPSLSIQAGAEVFLRIAPQACVFVPRF